MTTSNATNASPRSWSLIIVMSIIIVVSAAFLFMMFNWQPPTEDTVIDDEAELAARVTSLLAVANPANGEALTVTYGCTACHVAGATHGIAPAFAGVGDIAATRHPPLTAAEYIYQSIVHPTAHIVEGFANSMPQDFGTRLSNQELADILAYLLEQRSPAEATPASESGG